MDTQAMNQGQLLEISGNYWKACTLHAAVKLDIFTALASEQLTSGEITEKLNGDKRGVSMLLNALTAMNLLIKENDKYSNTSTSASFLSKENPQYIGHMIMHHHHLVASWSQLDQVVKNGVSIRKRGSVRNEEWRESFLMGMFTIAMGVAPRLAKKIDLSRRRHLLDLGGGPGTYAIHFCLNNPELKATVYDLPTTRPFAEKTIEKFGMTGRVDFKDGNYLEEGIKGVYDVVWLSHILHGEGPEDCQDIFRKTVSVLESGGMIVVHDFLLNNKMDGPLFPALFSLNMLLGTPKGQAYSERQITDMLSRVGAKEIRRIPFDIQNDSGVIIGVVD